MSTELEALFAQYAKDKTAVVSALIDLVASARRLNPDMGEHELLTLMVDVVFPIFHHALTETREVSLCPGSVP